MCTVGSPLNSPPPLPGVTEDKWTASAEACHKDDADNRNIVNKNIKIRNRHLLIYNTSSNQ